jgi:uncharacterized protein YcbK (DUF882 family)
MKRQKRRQRRHLLKSVLGTSLAGLLLPVKHALGMDEKRLSFYHTHTGETLDVTFARGGKFIQPALQEINEFLADFRTGDVTEIDPELLNLIYDIRESLGSRGRYEVISAYRSPKTNDMLRSRSSGVASKSQHLLGKAIDVRLDDVELPKLRDAALAQKRGGVGYYAKSNFVHVDTGRVRRW